VENSRAHGSGFVRSAVVRVTCTLSFHSWSLGPRRDLALETRTRHVWYTRLAVAEDNFKLAAAAAHVSPRRLPSRSRRRSRPVRAMLWHCSARARYKRRKKNCNDKKAQKTYTSCVGVYLYTQPYNVRTRYRVCGRDDTAPSRGSIYYNMHRKLVIVVSRSSRDHYNSFLLHFVTLSVSLFALFLRHLYVFYSLRVRTWWKTNNDK